MTAQTTDCRSEIKTFSYFSLVDILKKKALSAK